MNGKRSLMRNIGLLAQRKRIIIPLLAGLMVFMVRLPLVESENAARDRAHIGAYIDAMRPAGMTVHEKERLLDAIQSESQRLDIPDNVRIDGRPVNRAYLLAAYVRVESGFRRTARSTSDARGYMQVKPDTAAWLDGLYGRPARVHRMYETQVSLELGVDYINYLMTITDDPRTAALSYNMGPNNVARGYFEESYWTKIRDAYRLMQSGDYEGARL